MRFEACRGCVNQPSDGFCLEFVDRMAKAPPSITRLGALDLHLFGEGTHSRLYDKLGAHPMAVDGVSGTYFAVWAPNARSVCVSGDFNDWSRSGDGLVQRGASGIWEGFIRSARSGQGYKYQILSKTGQWLEKADPLAFRAEVPPRSASIICDLDYSWRDQDWMAERARRNALNGPISVYEIHAGSWRRVSEEGDRFLTYRELAARLPEYVREMGFSHVEFMPLMEHPFYPSWGYQTTGYFAPTSRYGPPQDLMYLIDCLHRAGIGVILDWTPSHFARDGHGLGLFDGTHLYEHRDPRQGVHPDWDSYVFNYGRKEVASFLTSSALFWLDKYHIDGLRVDAVASMLYLDYSRKPGEWLPNQFGGNENIEAINFLRSLNEKVYEAYPDVQTIAEESTSWPMVSRPTYVGGLGFGLKWDMGWMHDTLSYFSRDPVHRKWSHNQLTFRMLYAHNENFLLPLSHDEVVHGKSSLIGKMPGDDWRKFANLRLLFGYMFGQPGKKLLFMGGEFGQWGEWNHDHSLDWHLLRYLPHSGVQRWVRDLNELYRSEPALYERDSEPGGFEWVDCNDADNSALSFIRRGASEEDIFLFVYNFTPVPRYGYRVGCPLDGVWKEVANSDAKEYSGSDMITSDRFQATSTIWHGRPYSLELTLRPLSCSILAPERGRHRRRKEREGTAD